MTDPLDLDLTEIDLAVWKLDEAVKLIEQLEKVVKPDYHLGLTGSVLYSGGGNDLDIIAYPHHTEDAPRREIMSRLQKFGLKWQDTRDHSHYGDDKIVEQYQYQGKTIDIFFLK